VNADGLPTVFGVAFADDAFTHAPTLFGIDPELELLVGVGSAGGAPESPSTGTVRTIGRLDLDAASFGGFEIVPAGGPAFAAFGTTRGTTRLFAIDLTTGTPAVLGNIGVAEDVIGLAVAPTSNPRAPGDDLGIRRLDIRLDFAHGGRDSFAAEGTLPLQAGELAGRVVTVDVGGFSKTFTFGRGGRAAKDDETTRSRLDDDRFTFAERASDGRIGFTAIVRREDVAASLADEGLDGGRDVRREPRTVGVSVTIDGVTYTTSVVLRYTAAAGRSGTASRAGDVRRPLSPR
jgi:hypothetical protein